MSNEYRQRRAFDFGDVRLCHVCKGRGTNRTATKTCSTCRGSGVEQDVREGVEQDVREDVHQDEGKRS